LAEKEHLVRKGDEEKKMLAKEFIEVANIRRIDQQIDLIDAAGTETVKVDHSGGVAYAVAQPDLRNEAHRDYFQQAMSLKPGGFFVSYLDSDIEQKKSVPAVMPVIQLATPVVNTQGDWKGILVLNLLAGKLFEKIAGYEIIQQRGLMLLNEKGYGLYGGNTENASSRAFSTTNNEAWQQLMTLPAGQFRNKQGLFT